MNRIIAPTAPGGPRRHDQHSVGAAVAQAQKSPHAAGLGKVLAGGFVLEIG